MKLSKKITMTLGAIAFASALLSCGSTATLEPTTPKKEEPKQEDTSNEIVAKSTGSLKSVLPPPPAKATEAPRFDFSGESLKIEAENTYYDGFELVGDVAASSSYALKLLNDSSWAIAEVNFPAGTYEAVANVLSPDSNHTRFNLYINKDTYLIYGSEPPIGTYELTTRVPASFTLDAPATVTVKIQQNDIRNPDNNGHNGMTIDYIQFKKK